MTVPVGTVSAEATELMRTTREALAAGIEEARPGRRIGDVSAAIQAHAERHKFSVVRDFVGPWHRAASARRSAGAELRTTGPWHPAPRGHGPRDRADSQRWRSRGSRERGRVDGGDVGWQSLRPLRAFGRDRRERSVRAELAMSMPMPKSAKPSPPAAPCRSRCRTRPFGWRWTTVTKCWRTPRARSGCTT